MCFSVNLCIHVSHSEMMDPIDFGGHMSKAKVTMTIYRNKIVKRIETKPLCASSSNLADVLIMVKG